MKIRDEFVPEIVESKFIPKLRMFVSPQGKQFIESLMVAVVEPDPAVVALVNYAADMMNVLDYKSPLYRKLYRAIEELPEKYRKSGA